MENACFPVESTRMHPSYITETILADDTLTDRVTNGSPDGASLLLGDETGEKASGLASYWSKDLSSVVIDTTAPMFQLVYPCTALYCEFATLLPTLMLDGNRKLGMSVRPVRKTN